MDPRPHRHRIEHGGGLLERPEEMRRLKSLGILPVVTPHFWLGGPYNVPQFRSMIEHELRPVMVTDTTGTVPGSSAPLRNMAASMLEASDGGEGAAVVAERVGKSNLSLAAPVMRCAAPVDSFRRATHRRSNSKAAIGYCRRCGRSSKPASR